MATARVLLNLIGPLNRGLRQVLTRLVEEHPAPTNVMNSRITAVFVGNLIA